MSGFAKTSLKIAALLFLAEMWGGCTLDLDEAGGTVLGGRATIIVWVTRDDANPVEVTVSGQRVSIEPPSDANLVLNVTTVAPITRTVFDDERPVQETFQLGTGSTLLVDGAWAFDINISSPESPEFESITIRCNQPIPQSSTPVIITVFDMQEECSGNIMGDFAFDEEHDVEVLSVSVNPNPIPAGDTAQVNVTVSNSGNAPTEDVEVVVTANGTTFETRQIQDLSGTVIEVFNLDTSEPNLNLTVGNTYGVVAGVPAVLGEVGTHPGTGEFFDNTDDNSNIAFTAVTIVAADQDGDGIPDAGDNCPAVPNSDQADVDDDTVGDVCDNCRDVENGGQQNADGDALGDACDLQILGFLPDCPAPAGACNLVTSGDCNVPAPGAGGDNSGCLFVFGEGFDVNTASVEINNIAVQSSQVSACFKTGIFVEAPGTATDSSLRVTTPDGSVLASNPVCATSPPVCPGGLAVFGLTPPGGAGAFDVYVFGCGFSTGTPTVTIGSEPAQNVQRLGDSAIYFRVPNGTQSAKVTVTVNGIPATSARVLQIIN